MKFYWRLLAVCFWMLMMMAPLSSKPHPSLLKKLEKLEEYQKNSLKQYRGIHISKPDVPLPVKQPAEILAIEEEEAIIMQYAVTNLLDFANISIKLLPRLIRICSETTVGVFSAVMLGIGSVFNLVASSIQSMSHRLANTQHDPVFELPRRSDNGYSINPYYSLELNYLQNLSNTTEQDLTNLLSIDESFSSAKCLPLPANMSSSSLMKTNKEDSSLLPRFFMYRLNKSLMKFHFINSLNHSAKFFYGFSEALALTGEVTEAITLGLGEAIEDSFHHLQILSYLGQQAVDFMLINEIDAQYEQELIRQRHQNLTASKLKLKEQEQLIENRPDFIIVDESNESKTKQPTVTEEEENDPARKKPRKIYIKPNRDRTISVTESQNRKKISSSKGTIPNNPLISMNTSDDISFYSWLVNFLFNAMQYEKRLFEQSYDQFSYYASKTWEGVSLMIRNCVEIILYSLEIPSITFHLTFAFFILLLLVVLPFPTKQAQIYLITCVMIFFWIVIMAIEYTQRYRLIERVRIETMESYLQENMPKVFYNLSSIENMTPSQSFQQIPSISSTNKDSPDNLDTSSKSTSTSTSGSGSSEQSTFSVNLSKEYSMLLNQLPFFPTSPSSSSSASPSSSPSSPPGIPTMTEIEQIIASQKMIWFNTLLSLTWNILDDDFYNSGIGGYMSETYEELLNIELERIHETTQGMIRAIKLKKFHFGTNPPLMKSISTNLYRNATCVNQLVFQYAQQQTEKKNKLKNQQQQQHDSSYLSFLFPSASSSSSSSSSNEKRMRNHNKKDFLKRLKNYVSHSWNISKFISNEQEEMIYEFSEQITDYLFENLIPSALQQQQQPQQPQSATSSSSFSSSKNDPYSSGSSADTSPLSATTQKNKYVKQTAFFISCDTLIIDVNMVYVSKDMDIIISLRTEDIKSMIPEFTVTLSELIFDGWIRFKIQLTNDYPFFGNTTMSFLQLPQLDFTVNSFGGVDISTIPYAFHFVNSSLYVILEEYTEPHSMEIDLRHTLCPTCDQVAPRLFTIENILQDTLLTTKRMYQSIWRKGMSFVSEKVGKFMNFWKSGKWKNIFSFGKKKKIKTRIDDEYYWDHSYAN